MQNLLSDLGWASRGDKIIERGGKTPPPPQRTPDHVCHVCVCTDEVVVKSIVRPFMFSAGEVHRLGKACLRILVF